MDALEEEARGGAGGEEPAWIRWASVSTMVMALFSAAAGLMAGKAANEAIIGREEEIVEIIDLDRAELEHEVLLNRTLVLESMGRVPEPSLLRRIEADAEAIQEYQARASQDRAESTAALDTHELFAVGTTVLSMAITLTAMAVIVRRKAVWYVGVGIAAAGAAILAYGFATLFTT